MVEQEILDAINSDVCVIDFYANWCGPCKLYLPVMDKIALILEDRAKVIKVDIDQFPKIAQQYNVKSVPTTVLFKGGLPMETLIGGRTMDEVVNKVEKLI